MRPPEASPRENPFKNNIFLIYITYYWFRKIQNVFQITRAIESKPKSCAPKSLLAGIFCSLLGHFSVYSPYEAVLLSVQFLWSGLKCPVLYNIFLQKSNRIDRKACSPKFNFISWFCSHSSLRTSFIQTKRNSYHSIEKSIRWNFIVTSMFAGIKRRNVECPWEPRGSVMYQKCKRCSRGSPMPTKILCEIV